MTFVILYNPGRGEIESMTRFADTESEAAATFRLTAELEHRDDINDFEIVTLIADDEATLRRTHARYFYTTKELLKAFPLQ